MLWATRLVSGVDIRSSKYIFTQLSVVYTCALPQVNRVVALCVSTHVSDSAVIFLLRNDFRTFTTIHSGEGI